MNKMLCFFLPVRWTMRQVSAPKNLSGYWNFLFLFVRRIVQTWTLWLGTMFPRKVRCRSKGMSLCRIGKAYVQSCSQWISCRSLRPNLKCSRTHGKSLEHHWFGKLRQLTHWDRSWKTSLDRPRPFKCTSDKRVTPHSFELKKRGMFQSWLQAQKMMKELISSVMSSTRYIRWRYRRRVTRRLSTVRESWLTPSLRSIQK